MLNASELIKDYKDYRIRESVPLICDYCGISFSRIKKSREKSKTIAKDSCGGKECSLSKREETCLHNHGEKNVFQSETVKNQIKLTNKENFGSEIYFQSQDFKDKRKTTLLENFGVDSPLKNEDIKNKQIATCKEKYDVENYSQHPDCLPKKIATNRKKYNKDYASQSDAVKEQTRQTSRQRYQRDFYTQTQEHTERKKKTCTETYGVDHTSKLPSNRELAKQTTKTRHGEDNYAKTKEFKERFLKTCLEKFGVPNPLCLKQNRIYGKAQKEIQDWLISLNHKFNNNDYSILKTQEIDLYCDQLKLGIEYCGLFWHNELSPQPRLKNYHYDKYKNCLDQNIRLITIFEDEWKLKKEQCKNIIQSILGVNVQKIHARKCSIQELDKTLYSQFCDQHHLLGSNQLSIIAHGLFFNNELVGAISLGRHPRNNSSIVLDRLVFKNGIQIVGGASRLFSQCKKWANSHDFTKIISWSDNRWSQGNVYQQLNFQLEQDMSPDYSYVNLKNCSKRISKQSQKKSLTGCPGDKTEYEWSLENNLARIWDCGKKRWVFKLTQK